MKLFGPIPVLAWVPIAILMFTGIASREAPVVFLTFLAAFTPLSSIPCWAWNRSTKYIFERRVVSGKTPPHFLSRCTSRRVPFVFTGLQIAVGVGWFSLVAAEMISGEYGLGFLIWDSYVLSQFEVIIIAMMTLGVIGYSSARSLALVGQMLMRWNERGGGR